MQTHLDHLLAPGALSAVFQPVFDARPEPASVFAYEGLVRGPLRSNFEQPNVMFGYVRHKRGEEQIDRACVATILGAAPSLPPDARISINVHAATLGRHRNFADYVVMGGRLNGIAPHRIVLEIVEHGSVWNEPRFLAGVRAIRDAGLGIALDDVGAGLSNYKMILDTRPDFFKIDRYLVTGCSRDRDRRVVLASIRDLATAFGGRAIAEGVENEDELRCLLDLGIELMQGFLFARPQPAAAFHSGAARQHDLPLVAPQWPRPHPRRRHSRGTTGDAGK